MPAFISRQNNDVCVVEKNYSHVLRETCKCVLAFGIWVRCEALSESDENALVLTDLLRSQSHFNCLCLISSLSLTAPCALFPWPLMSDVISHHSQWWEGTPLGQPFLIIISWRRTRNVLSLGSDYPVSFPFAAPAKPISNVVCVCVCIQVVCVCVVYWDFASELRGFQSREATKLLRWVLGCIIITATVAATVLMLVSSDINVLYITCATPTHTVSPWREA